MTAFLTYYYHQGIAVLKLKLLKKEREQLLWEIGSLRNKDPGRLVGWCSQILVGSSRLTSGRLLQSPYLKWENTGANKFIIGTGTRVSVQPSK